MDSIIYVEINLDMRSRRNRWREAEVMYATNKLQQPRAECANPFALESVRTFTETWQKKASETVRGEKIENCWTQTATTQSEALRRSREKRKKT